MHGLPKPTRAFQVASCCISSNSNFQIAKYSLNSVLGSEYSVYPIERSIDVIPSSAYSAAIHVARLGLQRSSSPVRTVYACMHMFVYHGGPGLVAREPTCGYTMGSRPAYEKLCALVLHPSTSPVAVIRATARLHDCI